MSWPAFAFWLFTPSLTYLLARYAIRRALVTRRQPIERLVWKGS